MIYNFSKTPINLPSSVGQAHPEGSLDIQFNNANMFATCTGVPSSKTLKQVSVYSDETVKVLFRCNLLILLGSEELCASSTGLINDLVL